MRSRISFADPTSTPTVIRRRPKRCCPTTTALGLIGASSTPKLRGMATLDGWSLRAFRCQKISVRRAGAPIPMARCPVLLAAPSSTMPLICVRLQLIRIEEIATDLGIEVTMDMVPEDRLQGTGVRKTPAGTPGHEIQRASRSGINIRKRTPKAMSRRRRRCA